MKAKSIATHDFSTLYTTFSQRLCNIIDFVFEDGNRTHILFPKIMLQTGEKIPKTTYLLEEVCKTSYANYYFKLLFFDLKIYYSDRKKGIPMGIDPAPLWATLFYTPM